MCNTRSSSLELQPGLGQANLLHGQQIDRLPTAGAKADSAKGRRSNFAPNTRGGHLWNFLISTFRSLPLCFPLETNLLLS